MTNGVDGTAFAGNLRIQNHQILQTLLDILLRGGQPSLLFLNLLLYLLALFL